MGHTQVRPNTEHFVTLLIAEGPSFTFHVVADSPRDARRAFAKAWKRHVKQTGADEDPENAVTFNLIDKMIVGHVYRDYEAL